MSATPASGPVGPRRYRITHLTRFAYTGPVRASHNEVRMTPLTEEGQATLESRLRIRPLSWSHTYRDYWGTHVTALETSGPHEGLELQAVSTVERYHPGHGSAEQGVGWDDLRSPLLRDRSCEWLQARPRTRLPDEVVAELAASAGDGGPGEAVAAVVDAVRGHLVYQPGVTVATSTAADAWEAGKGVCQDFVHATLGVLRHLGIPGRYVSGYLMPDDARLGVAVAGESHAWLEWWDGRWRGVDPTNERDVGLEHVVVGRGRDYDDVTPFKGVYLGDEEASLTVEVTLTRLS